MPDWFNISGTVSYLAARTRGTGYTHYNHNWSWDATAMLTHWGFNLAAQYYKSKKELYGETIGWGETASLVMLAYNWTNWMFGVGALNPFNKYDRGSRSLNKYNINVMHNRLDMNCMPFIKICYNLQWGHQKRGANKLVNAEATTDKSTAGSR